MDGWVGGRGERPWAGGLWGVKTWGDRGREGPWFRQGQRLQTREERRLLFTKLVKFDGCVAQTRTGTLSRASRCIAEEARVPQVRGRKWDGEPG